MNCKELVIERLLVMIIGYCNEMGIWKNVHWVADVHDMNKDKILGPGNPLGTVLRVNNGGNCVETSSDV